MAGWWWNPTTPSSPSNDNSTSSTSQTPEEHPATSSQRPQSEVARQDGSRQPTGPASASSSVRTSSINRSASARLDQLNRDEDSALDELRAAFSSSSSSSTSDPSTSSDSTSPSTTAQPPAHPADDPEPLYPTTLSCAACFDAAYYCSSIGGQLNNVYRHGAMRTCNELWAQWRFCMRTKTMGDEERRRRIWEWNREKEARKMVGRSSDEVWGARTGTRTREEEEGEGEGEGRREWVGWGGFEGQGR